ncbi:hypothetical protein BDZ97DRAFT_1827130 [Flammula alnicola]|nr:hypothetical protein BDZ97DRAFT_1827130 [Flammula alnicola]
MKFSLISLVVSVVLFSQAFATPTPQTDQEVVFHCGFPTGKSCPIGYRCCGPLNVKTGGT